MTLRAYIIILVLFSSVPVGAQIGAIAAAATVDSGLAQIRNSLTSIISQTETSTSVAGFSVAADATVDACHLPGRAMPEVPYAYKLSGMRCVKKLREK